MLAWCKPSADCDPHVSQQGLGPRLFFLPANLSSSEASLPVARLWPRFPWQVCGPRLAAACAFRSRLSSFWMIALSSCHPRPGSLSWKRGAAPFPTPLLPRGVLSSGSPVLLNCLRADTAGPLPDSSLCPALSPSCHLSPLDLLSPPPHTHTHFPGSIREFSIKHHPLLLKICAWLPQAPTI